jgi:exopolysaccharide biosynthesis WecB/TagA/CpsF family protein
METFTLRNYSISKEYVFDHIPSTKTLITTINPHSWVMADRDNEFQSALQDSDILLPDGVGIVLTARLLWRERFPRLAGSDLHKMILTKLNQVSGRCFYLGASPQVLSRIRQKLQMEYPNIEVGTYTPPFRKTFSEEENLQMINAVNQFKPDVLFVGMTAPKQEKWLHRHKSLIQANVMCAIGGAFDFYAETVPRAPQWMIEHGLEWLHRLLQEPKRMWKRNLVSTPSFILKMLLLKCKQKLHLFALIAALFMASCTGSKKVAYLQDAAGYARQKIAGAYPVKIGIDDVLSVTVSSKDTVLTRPFSRSPGGQGFLVDADGNIDYPVFGQIKAAELTTTALADSIRTRLINGGHIKDPIVTVKLLNFKISVMGEVNRPGVFPIPSERVTVLEAITMAGDMTVYGRRDKVLIIREEDGQRDMHYLDVNSTALFSSPYYYLRQNDLVYVEPNKAKAAQSEFDPRLPVILTGASVLTSLVSLIILIAK